ncbi:uncharacterized protein LACBIDRAFT_325317 [Laccaria bicolor S238N-H82]|uniref:Predicted protein n=1 Tax=Laccaria bicolor (strain S238N-H82 / ATCC MYA-4686) TaxID=486041 RepID=B0D4I6_LACBS|nr:uncharacterized protein LACBIDRAFT_325317 [Laccaria bicolor S238N-H82]EDR10351.1 predicted protein [Laccaria bicolor S238N-H82]|eukprot:XP_001878801.1 predicted protein [Laccaria bicolor S238N-H82]
MFPPPPPAPDSCKNQIILIPSLVAALVKLNIKTSVEDLMKAVHEEDEARCVKSNEEAERALISNTTLQSDWGVNGPGARADLLAEEHCCRLMDLSREAFPDGKVPKNF